MYVADKTGRTLTQLGTSKEQTKKTIKGTRTAMASHCAKLPATLIYSEPTVCVRAIMRKLEERVIEPQSGERRDALRYLHAESTPDQAQTASPTRGFRTMCIYL